MRTPSTDLLGEIRAELLPFEEGRVAVKVNTGDRIYFDTSVEPDRTMTPWVTLLTPIAMRAHLPLRLEGPADPSAKLASLRAQEVMSSWFPRMRQVSVEAQWSPSPPPGQGVGLFFSGGVDSFYSALEHDAEITHYLFVLGFDISLGKKVLAEKATNEVREMARRMGKSLLLAKTNLRWLSGRFAAWGRQYHGAALAGIAQLFSPVIGKAIVPSSFAPPHIVRPWGSDPELDHLWSSTVQIVHDEQVARFEKVTRIAESQVALDHLRVCYESRELYNCGKCEKCLRTMVALKLLGALERCQTLPHRIQPGAVARLHLQSAGKRFARDNLERLREA